MEKSKRIAQRKIKRLPIVFSDRNEEHQGTSSDFSSSGLFIRTRKPFSPGTIMIMVLELEDNSKIPLKGVVARTLKTRGLDLKNGMGVRLTSIPKAYEDFIQKLYQD